MMETWYVMADGAVGDPRDIRAGADGVLRHKDGRAVAYAPHGPRTRSVDVAALPKAVEPPARDVTAAGDNKAATDDREMKPATGGRRYQTRGGRTD